MELQQRKSLRAYNTFGIDVYCDYFGEFTNVQELQFIIKEYAPLMQKSLMIGQGSNLLFMGNYKGFILHSQIKEITILKEDPKQLEIRVGSGMLWDELVKWSVDKDWSGIENLSLIPGEVGAAAVQNIGAYGVEIKNVVVAVEAVHSQSGEKRVFDLKECKYDYRDSIFKRELEHQYIITYVVFCLHKQHQFNVNYGNVKEELEKYGTINLHNIREAIVHIRKEKLPDPLVLRNAGSFFKNPVIEMSYFLVLQEKYPEIPHYPADTNQIKIPAAWLIDQCGWKGKRFGDAGVHTEQALVLVNHGKASGEEIYRLACEITDAVLVKFGISLEMEVILVK